MPCDKSEKEGFRPIMAPLRCNRLDFLGREFVDRDCEDIVITLVRKGGDDVI